MLFLNVKNSLPKELEYFSSKRKAIVSLGVPVFMPVKYLYFSSPPENDTSSIGTQPLTRA